MPAGKKSQNPAPPLRHRSLRPRRRARAFARIRRGLAEFSLTLATGRPDLYPETPISVRGFKAEIDAESWLIAEVAHRLDGGGYTCSLKLEARLKEERAGEEKADKEENAQA